MTKPNSPNSPNRHYSYNNTSKIVWYSDFIPENRPDLIYIGTSDNPKIAMAAAVFMKKFENATEYSLRELLS